MKYSVACCYLTHNHSDVVNEILNLSLKDYAQHDIDIYIYDDSDDTATKEVVDNFCRKGFKNLFYIDAHIAKGGDHKYLLIMQGFGLCKEYDYIWPCKDRVCFSSSYLDRLCKAIDEGHDVVIGGNELSRWSVGSRVYIDIYTEPVEFYRKYAVYTTNWESLIRKKVTMLNGIDLEKYKNLYRIGENCSFNQSLSTFARLSELDHCSIRICRYDYSERHISQMVSSNWKTDMFKIWIDEWIAANFSLPHIYDRYKVEAIKSETNLSELFGSIENMINWHTRNIFSYSVFKKYEKVWPFVTEISIPCLEYIAQGNYIDARNYAIRDFEESISNRSFERAWWLIASNKWFEEVYDNYTYTVLVAFFNLYRSNMMQYGVSSIFDEINSISDMIKKFECITSKNHHGQEDPS